MMGLGLAYAARPLPTLRVGDVWRGVRPWNSDGVAVEATAYEAVHVCVTDVPPSQDSVGRFMGEEILARGRVLTGRFGPGDDVVLTARMLRNATLVTPAPDRSWIDRLRALGACEAGMEFAAQFDSWQACWDACRRWYWLEWVVDRIHGESARWTAYKAVEAAFRKDRSDGWPTRVCDAIRALRPVAPDLWAVEP